MRPGLKALAAALLAGLPMLAQAGLNVSVSGGPNPLAVGQQFTVLVQVGNNDSTNYVSGTSVWLGIQPSGFGPVLISSPSPASQNIQPSGTAFFTWTFSGSACGDVLFTATATGTDTGTSASVSSGFPSGFLFSIPCTPTPTPTVSPTPWVVYGTPTAVPQEASASIPGNIFHPMNGGQLQLRFDAPYEGVIQVDLYDRLGRHVKHFERNVMPGSYAELWDGRSDDGLLVASGIYVAHFRGKGLSRTVKFAVVK